MKSFLERLVAISSKRSKIETTKFNENLKFQPGQVLFFRNQIFTFYFLFKKQASLTYSG